MRSEGSYRTCPSCSQSGLASTGAFLRCGHCGYAITAQALAREGKETPGRIETPLRETA
jgi:hypothetical protein